MMNPLLKSAFFTGITLLFPLKSIAQSCDELLAQPIRIPADTSQATIAAFEQDLLLLFQCSGLDSLDFEWMIRGPVLGTVMVLAAGNDRQVTYGNWLEEMEKFKKTEIYANARQLVERTDALLRKKVLPGDWPQDSLSMVEIGLPAPVIQYVREIVLKKPPDYRTYEEIFKALGFREIVTESIDTTSAEKVPYWKNDTLDYPEALTLSRQSNKPVLLFFNAFAAINARKMEEVILSNPITHRYIEENFIVLTLYVDDRTPLPAEQHYTSASSSRVRRVGGRNEDLQIEKFQKNIQPYFYILDANEKILGESGYSRDKTSFLQFLTEGVKAFGK